MKNFNPSTKLAVKLVLEFMPLGLFFLASTEYDYWVSTAVLMIATVFSLFATWHLFRQLALMAIITAITSVGAGGITLLLHDPAYVQMKPTIVGFTFAAILLAGIYLEKPLFKLLLGQNLYLSDDGWRVLTWLWFGYFVFISVLNEIIWRNYSWEFWAAFKAFGLMPLTVIYALPQMYFLRKYRTRDVKSPAATLNESKAARGAKPAAAEAPAE